MNPQRRRQRAGLDAEPDGQGSSRMAVLQQFGHDIWIAGGPNLAVAGFHYPTRMAIVRLADGALFIWSPVRLTEQMQAGVDALGQVRHIVAPNSLHHLFLASGSPWHARRQGCAGILAPRLRVAVGVMISSLMWRRCGSTA
ncbi:MULTISPECIES: hypothetical protein [unclassified Bradyrhizobium]